MRGLYQVRTLACVEWFTPHGGLAQMAERPLCMRQVRGSMPLSSTFGLSVLAFHQHSLGDVAQMVERVLSMHEAMGSNAHLLHTLFSFRTEAPSGLLFTGFDPQRATTRVFPPL